MWVHSRMRFLSPSRRPNIFDWSTFLVAENISVWTSLHLTGKYERCIRCNFGLERCRWRFATSHTATAMIVEVESCTSDEYSATMTCHFSMLWRNSAYFSFVKYFVSSGNCFRFGNRQSHCGSIGMAARTTSTIASKSSFEARRIEMHDTSLSRDKTDSRPIVAKLQWRITVKEIAFQAKWQHLMSFFPIMGFGVKSKWRRTGSAPSAWWHRWRFGGWAFHAGSMILLARHLLGKQRPVRLRSHEGKVSTPPENSHWCNCTFTSFSKFIYISLCSQRADISGNWLLSLNFHYDNDGCSKFSW